jgi:hypothetical protein
MQLVVCSIAIETSIIMEVHEASVAMVDIGASMQLCLQAESHRQRFGTSVQYSVPVTWTPHFGGKLVASAT